MLKKLLFLAMASLLMAHMPSAVAIEVWEKTLVENSRLVDARGNLSGNNVNINQKVLIMSDLRNTQGSTQEFFYIVQIKDASRGVVSLSWFTGSLNEFQSLSASLSWIPQKSGEFTVEIFVWDSLKRQLPLSAAKTIGITVS